MRGRVSVVDGLAWWSNLFILPVLILLAGQLWALFDAALTSATRWRDAGYRKGLWLAVLWFTWPLGLTVYVLRVRPRLRRALVSID